MPTTVAQYCINVTDLERSVRFYEDLIGLPVQTRIETDDFSEIVLAAHDGGGRLQLAYHRDQDGPIDHGNALWKIYFNVEDAEETHRRVVEAGYESESAPKQLDRWPVTVAFVRDPDGYLIELLQRHAD
ncbi:MAG: VOC family protein [Acidimicrobiales bacterium]